MRRGDIVTVATKGTYTGKPRPALVIQSDLFGETESVTVLLITTELKGDAPMMRVPLTPDEENNLRAPSEVMIDKITTIHRDHARATFGKVSETDMRAIVRALAFFLGFGG